METQERSSVENPALEATEIRLTKLQAAALPAAIEDAEYFKGQAKEMIELARQQLQECIDQNGEEWRIAMRAERISSYELEHFRAHRLVRFLENIKARA